MSKNTMSLQLFIAPSGLNTKENYIIVDYIGMIPVVIISTQKKHKDSNLLIHTRLLHRHSKKSENNKTHFILQ